MRKLSQNDEVIVITGKDKGKIGKIVAIVQDGKKALVEGINLVKKHQKPNPQRNVEGGVIEKSMPVNISNLAIYNPVTKKADRVGFKFLDDGQKVRFFKSNQEQIDVL